MPHNRGRVEWVTVTVRRFEYVLHEEMGENEEIGADQDVLTADVAVANEKKMEDENDEKDRVVGWAQEIYTQQKQAERPENAGPSGTMLC